MDHMNNNNPFLPAPETKCTTCGSGFPLVTLLPCKHNVMCVTCVTHFSRHHICPICTNEISYVRYPGRTEMVLLQDFFTYQDAVDLDTRKKTLQVLLMGSAGSTMKSLIEGFTQSFPMYPTENTVRGPFRGIFRPNVKPLGYEMRVMASESQTSAGIEISNIEWQKPDVVVILIKKTVSYLRNDFQEFNAILKDLTVSILWVLVPGPAQLAASPAFVESIVREIPQCPQVIEGNVEFIDMTKSKRGLERAALMKKIITAALESRDLRKSEFVPNLYSTTTQAHNPYEVTSSADTM